MRDNRSAPTKTATPFAATKRLFAHPSRAHRPHAARRCPTFYAFADCAPRRNSSNLAERNEIAPCKSARSSARARKARAPLRAIGDDVRRREIAVRTMAARRARAGGDKRSGTNRQRRRLRRRGTRRAPARSSPPAQQSTSVQIVRLKSAKLCFTSEIGRAKFATFQLLVFASTVDI